MADSTCSVDGCDKPRHYANGWCPMHYQRWQKHGSLDKPKPRPRPEAPLCTEPDCDSPGNRKGLCERHYKRAHYLANRDRAAASQAARREANREQYLKACRDYYRANRAVILARMAELYMADPHPKRQATAAWRKANPIKVREYELRRRARKRETQTEPVDYVAILAEHGMFCHICSLVIVDQSDLHFDHLIPLSMGGPHTAENIKPAHALCNIRKGGRWAS